MKSTDYVLAQVFCPDNRLSQRSVWFNVETMNEDKQNKDEKKVH